jgi:photosystem II stability/assembly factor-like uncharacterized protein
MPRRHLVASLLALAVLPALLPTLLHAAPIDPDLLAGMKARSIGPAVMSGRVTSIDAVASNPDVIYVGAAAGGVWKSVNGGLSWNPIFDDQPVASIGAIAINQQNPDVVWVATGEGNMRNSLSVGNGVYRTLDGGRTWQHLGLDKTEHIFRIALHPTDPNVAWVSALGQEWGENPERGVYKTTDGGKSWRRVLYVDAKTGASDLIIDPRNPNKLYASMWQFRRWPWFFKSGGPGSGLYVSYDGGESWKRCTSDDGLPKGDLGRIGLAISRSSPDIVYALVEAEKSALIRSTDGGKSWQTANDDQRTAERPFYYSDIQVDPAWPNRVYNLTASLQVSDDSGKTFAALGRSREVHGDYHAMWLDPRDPEHLIVGSDGAVAVSRDRGETWQFLLNLPFGQYYHIAVDMDRPYNVYGGLQDNGSWRGPSAVWDETDIRNHRWDRVGGGDGFDTRPDPQDSMIGYSMSQGGELVRWNLRTRENRAIQPAQPAPGDGHEKLRFNWNAGFAQDPFDPATIYLGSQYVHKSTDRGESWTIISPDLTTDKPEWQKQSESGGLTLDATNAENFTTILAIAPSPRERGLLWVGTDDGRLQLTRDGGATWTSLEKNVPGVPANTWIPHIVPSKYAAASAFVVFDNHRREDMAPYVYRTDDYGKTWKSLATSDLRGYALAIEQDPADKDLLFLGTEFGLWVSFDGGDKWLPWRHGIPTTSVMDLVIHPRDLDLGIATHGRALFILDDIRPLREITDKTLAEPLHLYTPGPALLYRRAGGGPGGGNRAGAWEFRGENRAYGAILTYSLNRKDLPLPDADKERARKEAAAVAKAEEAPKSEEGPKGSAEPGGHRGGKGAYKEPGEEKKGEAAKVGEKAGGEKPPGEPAVEKKGEGGRGEGRSEEKGPQVEIRISDAAGKVIRTFKQPAVQGVNRAVWDLGRDPFDTPPTDNRGRQRDANRTGPTVIPGTYGVTVKLGDQEAKGTIQIESEPDLKVSGADWQEWDAAIQRAGALQNGVVAAINRLNDTRADVDAVLRKLEPKTDKERNRPESEDPNAPLRKAAKDLQKKIGDVEKTLFVPPTTKGITEDTSALNRIENANRGIGSAWGKPTANTRQYLEAAERRAKEALAAFNKLQAEDVAAFRKKVEEAKLDLLVDKGPVEVK